ncbi:hypothetical protein C6P42_001217 [Pichia californica]|nr:hypothetical protein C6P42_001217 [[Candida] californica]
MTSLYGINKSNDELSNSLNRLSINTNIISSSTLNQNQNQNIVSFSNSDFTILKIKNIPMDISFREASLIFSLCLNDVNFIDIIHEPTSNSPIILSKFHSPKIASQVHQLLNDKPLFGTSFPNVICELIYNSNHHHHHHNQQQQQQQQQQIIPKSNSYLFTNPFISSNIESTSPTSPNLQISKPFNNDNLENLNQPSTNSLNNITKLNGSSNNINQINSINNMKPINKINLGTLSNLNAWSNETTSTPITTPLRSDPLLLNSSNTTTTTSTTISNSNLPTPIISEWSQSNNLPNNNNNNNNNNNVSNNNYFNSNNLNINNLATPSSANFSIPTMIHQNIESPIDNNTSINNLSMSNNINDNNINKNQQIDSVINDSSFINDENINNINIKQYHSQLQRHHSNDLSLPSPSNQSDLLRHYSNPQSSTSNPSSNSSNSIPTAQQIPELSLLARVPPPANPADQNPPCNTLYVGNLPPDTSEIELRSLFQSQPGFKRLSFRTKQTNGITSHHGPMCFVEFDDVSFATRALAELYGRTLPRQNNVPNNKGGIRLSFSKNPLGVRSPGQQRRNNSTSNNNNSNNNNNNNSNNNNSNNNNNNSSNNSIIPPPSSSGNKSLSGPSVHSQNNTQRNNSLPISSNNNNTNNNNNNNNNHSVNYNTSNINEFNFMNQQFSYQ